MKIKLYVSVVETIYDEHRKKARQLTVGFLGVISSPAIPREGELLLFPICRKDGQEADPLEAVVTGVQHKLQDGVLQPAVDVESELEVDPLKEFTPDFDGSVLRRKELFLWGIIPSMQDSGFKVIEKFSVITNPGTVDAREEEE